MRPVVSYVRISASLLMSLSLLGCPGRHVRPDDYTADPAPLFAALQRRADAVQSLTASLKLEVWRGGERVRLRQLVALRRPDSLRIDSLSPFDQPLSTLVTDGQTLRIYSLEEKRFYVGAATARSLARLVPVRLEPSELVELMRGGVPLGRHSEARVAWDDELGWYQLDLVGPQERRQVHFEPSHLRVVSLRAWSGDTLRYSVRFGDYDGEDDASLPGRLRLEAPAEEVRVDIRVEDVRKNPELPDQTFTLEVPRGVPVVRLDE